MLFLFFLFIYFFIFIYFYLYLIQIFLLFYFLLFSKNLGIEELYLINVKKFKGTALKSFAKSKSKRKLNLTKLNLSSCELSKEGFKQVVKISSNLQSLYFSPLSTSFKITSSDFLNLVNHCSKLEVLDLSNYHFEMDTILLEVSKFCVNIKTLILDGKKILFLLFFYLFLFLLKNFLFYFY